MSQWNQFLMAFENIFHVLDHLFQSDIQQGKKQRIPLEIVSSWKKSYPNTQFNIEYSEN